MKFRRKKPEPETSRRRSAADSPAVFSYYARGASDSQQNTGRHEGASSQKTSNAQRLSWRSVPSYMALLIISTAIIYALILQTSPKIVLINQPGTINRPAADYQKAISEIWQRSLLNRTKLTVHSKTIQTEIGSEFNELSDIQIELPLLGRRPTVILTPAKPAMQLVSANGAFYVDTRGKVLARTNEVAQNQLRHVPLIKDETGLPAEPGKAVVPEPEAIFLQKLAAQLQAEELPADSITLPRGAANEADVYITGQKYYLKFSVLSDPRQAVGSYLVVKNKWTHDNTTPSQYVDLRAEEKVFYK